MGDLSNAEAALKRVTALSSQVIDEVRTQAFFESSLGRVYLDLGNKGKAGKLMKSAKRLWQKAGNPEMNLSELL